MELGGSNAENSVALDVQLRCHLPQCHTSDNDNIHGDTRPSGMGYAILCHEGRELVAVYLLSYSLSVIKGKNVTYQIASDADSRGNFTRYGGSNNLQDTNPRNISDRFPVFAISRDLGTIQATTDPVVWAIGYTTDSAINYSDLSGAPPTPRSPYYKIRYSSDSDLVSIDNNHWEDYMSNTNGQIVDFLNDFSNASSRAKQPDDKIFQDSESVAFDLSRLTFIAIAELYGSMQLTIGTDARGNLNASDVMIFMKNIGGIQKKLINSS